MTPSLHSALHRAALPLCCTALLLPACSRPPAQPPAEQPPEDTEQVLPPGLDLPGIEDLPAIEEIDPPAPSQSGVAAVRHAGVVSAILALCASFIYLYYRRREE